MSSLYKIFSKNIKKEPNKIFIYSFNETFNGHNCKEKINFLRKFIKKHNIKNIGINYKNSADWFFWYLAADSHNCQVVLIKNGTPINELNKIKTKYQIDYIASKIPQTINLKLKINNNNEYRRQDILFTSGSLSLPKGVIISEKAYLHVAKILAKKLKQKVSDIELLSMPFDHSFGLVRLRCCILAGTKIFIADGLKKFPEIFKFSQENKLTGLSLVPSGLELIKFLLKNKANLFAKNLNYIEIGSSHIGKEARIWLKKNFSKTNIIHHYGMTEASRSFLLPRGKRDDLKKDINLIGKIIPGCKYKIDKTNSELLLKGKNLFESYFDQVDNRFIDGWFRTRDIVKKRLNELYLVGRVDNQFNIGGNKIQAEMIEDLIEDINHVKRCVCFTQPDKIYGNSLALIVENKNNTKKDNILKLIKKKLINLPDYYIPKKIFFKKVLLTKNGKKIRMPQKIFF